MSDLISRQALCDLVDAWIGQGKTAAGPTWVNPDVRLYAPVSAANQIVWDGLVHPGNSIKEFFFPRHEPIYTYRFKGHQIELEDQDPPKTEHLIMAARPCDAAAIAILDALFNWDFVDKFYNDRRAAATIVTLACTEYDSSCFCTTVGLGPAVERGSDALLLPIGDSFFEVRCLTEKGKALFAGKTQASEKTGKATPGPEKRLDLEWLREYLQENYENPVWREIVLRCLGCGACAYTCPTCHCFDIADEGDATGGRRVKNWDSCQFGMFTLHASGHNPRATQGQRQRQRIQHKFRICPEKFGEILCTGCGNCTRNCPVSLGVLSTLEALREHALHAPSEVTE